MRTIDRLWYELFGVCKEWMTPTIGDKSKEKRLEFEELEKKGQDLGG
jgi:hypothetical protein